MRVKATIKQANPRTFEEFLEWFSSEEMWLMMAQKSGISARNLCDTYGFGSYQTAWGWLRKVRSVMKSPAA